MSKPGYDAERERTLQLQEQGFLVMRASGSIGAGDLFAIMRGPENSELHARIEQVKSLKGKNFYFDKMSKSELLRLKEIYSHHQIDCYFVVKFKRKGWKQWHVKDIADCGQPLRWEEKA